MGLAEYSILDHCEMLSGRQLSATSVTRKAGEMKDELPGLSNPIRGRYTAKAFRTLYSKGPAEKDNNKIHSVFVMEILRHRSINHDQVTTR